MHDEGGDALQRHVDEDAECAEPQRDGRQHLGVLGVAHPEELSLRGDQGHADDLRRESAETRTRPVGAGGDRTGDRLAVDVAEVLHDESVGSEQTGDAVQPGTCEECHSCAVWIDRHQPLHVIEFEKNPGSHRDAGEAVTGADGLDLKVVGGSRLHGALHALRRARSLDAGRPHARRARPVLPRAAGTRHRNALPSPRYVGSSSITSVPATR